MQSENIGIIAGEGDFPIILAREIKKQGKHAICVAIKDKATGRIAKFMDVIRWIRFGELRQLIDIFIEHNVSEVMLAGKITKADFLFNANPSIDDEVRHLINSLSDTKVDTLLTALARIFKESGIELIDPTPYLSEYLPVKGILTMNKPNSDQEKDIQYGTRVAMRIADMDIGQTVILKGGVVLAVEAIEGTDEAIRRVAHLGIKGAVIVKVARPDQDMRFDIPVVGFKTIKTMKEAWISCLAIEANKTLILDKEMFLKEADAAGISVVAM